MSFILIAAHATNLPRRPRDDGGSSKECGGHRCGAFKAEKDEEGGGEDGRVRGVVWYRTVMSSLWPAIRSFM